MRKRKLRQLLEEKCGEEDFQFIIPHPLLPPRFRDLSENRNMILVLDMDLTLHVRWEGALSDEHLPLTPGELKRLLSEVNRKITTYRRDLSTFGKFAVENSEQPFEDPRNDPVYSPREPQPATKELEEDKSEIIAVINESNELVSGTMEEVMKELGGESPLPDLGGY